MLQLTGWIGGFWQQEAARRPSRSINVVPSSRRLTRKPLGRLDQTACALHCGNVEGRANMALIGIRACTHNDIDAVLTLDREWEQEAIAHVFVPISRDEFIESLTRFPSYFLVAEYNGRIVGYINGTVRIGAEATIIPVQERYVEIENVYVTAEFRHKQVGGQLVERLLEAAKQSGIQRFVVSSNSKQMEKIIAFYQSHGFKLWSVHLFQ